MVLRDDNFPADGVCNAAGLGFNGYDENGKPKWNLVSNINIIAIEVRDSYKHFQTVFSVDDALRFSRLPPVRKYTLTIGTS